MLNSVSVCRCLSFEIRTTAPVVICLLRRVMDGLVYNENGFRVKNTICEMRHKRYHATHATHICVSVSPLCNRIIQRKIGIVSPFLVTRDNYYEDFGTAHLMPCGLVNKRQGGYCHCIPTIWPLGWVFNLKKETAYSCETPVYTYQITHTRRLQV